MTSDDKPSSDEDSAPDPSTLGPPTTPLIVVCPVCRAITAVLPGRISELADLQSFVEKELRQQGSDAIPKIGCQMIDMGFVCRGCGWEGQFSREQCRQMEIRYMIQFQ